jgi:hypothetical protein
MKLQNRILLTPAQQRAMAGILGDLPAVNVIVLRSAAGMGRSTVLQRVQEVAGGALVETRQLMEEAFLDRVEQALAVHDVAIVDDLHLVANMVNHPKSPRAHLLDAALTGIMGQAAGQGKKLVFGVEGMAPWPVRRRAYRWEIGAFSIQDVECICWQWLPAEIAERLDYRQIQSFAPALSARGLKNACNWLTLGNGAETETRAERFVEHLRSHHASSNAEIEEAQWVGRR